MAPPNFHNVGGPNGLQYSDKTLQLITPPAPKAIACSTLQGLVDLYEANIDDAKKDGDVLVQITSPTSVELFSRESDKYGRRRVWAEADCPKVDGFPFGSFLNPENFIIMAQQYFQRVKVEKDDGTFAKDLDYVFSMASKITGGQTVEHEDDGITQRVAVKQGVALKTEQNLRPIVNLAPYRTFAEIDQVLSTFVFRARVQGEAVQLALFEGDGGRWKINAISAIKAWLESKVDLTIIS